MRGVEKLTQNAVSAIRSSYNFAEGIKSPELTIEHLFVGLISTKTGIASKVLKVRGLDINKTISKVRGRIVEKVKKESEELVVSEDFKSALRAAFSIASELKHVYVGTEHLLLGVLAQKTHPFVKDLKNSGITEKEARKQIRGMVQYPSGVLSGGKKETTVLDLLATNLTSMAKKGVLDPVIGREEEIERVVNILARRTKNNPIIVGDPGVGKTAVVEGLAQKIVQGEVSSVLLGYEIWALDTATLVAGSSMRGEIEAKVLALIDEIESRGNVILFIDEMHNILGAGSGPGGVSVANILKPALSKGKLHCVGATTTAEYSKTISSDPALTRRFQPVQIEELSVDDTVEILRGLKPVYEAFHDVKVGDDALEQAAKLSKRFVTDRYLPDKAVDLIDEACARIRVGKLSYTSKYQKLLAETRKLYYEKSKLLDKGKYDKAAEVREKQEKTWKEFEQYRKQVHKKWKKKPKAVSEDSIRKVISEWTGIPIETISTSEAKRLLGLKRRLSGRVVGQEYSVDAVVSAVKRARTGVAEEERPLASLLFLGPTGVGKTELAKQLALQLFGDLSSFVQIDMSEMMESHSVSKLIGAPPGYVGFDQGGQLTEQIWKKPYSVILFDEIEKAHSDVLNILLQVLEEGSLTDGRGKKVSFKNAVIIMTSNIGADEISASEDLGFTISHKSRVNKSRVDQAYEDMKEKITSRLKEEFRPEFLNRIDEIVIFRALTMNEVEKIVDIQLEDLNDRMEEKEIKVEVKPNLIKKIAEEGYSETYGARPIKRQIQEKVEAPLADLLLKESPKPGSTVVVEWKNAKPTARVKGAKVSSRKRSVSHKT